MYKIFVLRQKPFATKYVSFGAIYKLKMNYCVVFVRSSTAKEAILKMPMRHYVGVVELGCKHVVHE